ncbi:putative amino acid decarboxylase, pyridoxal-dependent protein [Modestobacter italicus]|uniref:Amino acid decarboxylase, pyridoxal-dependent protein n=1 Tax=Modestobacter italicus (strain DSM 44449 / CECT 9708 / BC 501) TaxID=2732864 RepID=I4EUT2_MODI5|nr:pyridoxal-dependent decarboxylase [Modestobacter marinus]CCH87145.1 putative amino acid decarboxylase, pyridoxal-dependent protein [Modestobacter marinus]
MGAAADAYDEALRAAAEHARSWLHELPDRRVPPAATADEVRARALELLSQPPAGAAQVVDELAALAEPGLMAINSGRFFGWVMGGVLPASLGADWLVSSWDQNTGMRAATPGVAGVEEAAGEWLVHLLGLPAGSAVGFSTGATTANTSCLAAGRHAVLTGAGWAVEEEGLAGGPRVRVLVGADSHVSVDLALRYLGLGRPEQVAVDDQGRLRTDALARALDGAPAGTPTIVCLQAGNLHSGAFDPLGDAADLAHRHGAWVHVDGAFGLWAAASPALAHLVGGLDRADSWATDAHKTLNVPYDCGVAVVRDPALMRAALGVRTSYLLSSDVTDPVDVTVEMSRRARGVPVWAALRSLGQAGVAALVDRLVEHAQALARGLAGLDGAAVLNDVVYTQVCVSFGSDERTAAVTAAVISDGTVWMSGSRWAGRAVLRVSVSNWSTDAADVEASVDAVRRAVAAVDGRRRGTGTPPAP